MNLHDIHTLFAYNEWAHARIFTCIDRLNDEQISHPLGGSFPSLRDTLAHVAGAEWVWLERFKGVSPSSFPPWLTGSSYAELKAKLAEVSRDRAVYLAGLTEEDLARPLAYRNLAGKEAVLPLGLLFQHVVNHSTYHRGQLVHYLRQLGAEAVATDYVLYQIELGKG